MDSDLVHLSLFSYFSPDTREKRDEHGKVLRHRSQRDQLRIGHTAKNVGLFVSNWGLIWSFLTANRSENRHESLFVRRASYRDDKLEPIESSFCIIIYRFDFFPILITTCFFCLPCDSPAWRRRRSFLPSSAGGRIRHVSNTNRHHLFSTYPLSEMDYNLTP